MYLFHLLQSSSKYSIPSSVSWDNVECRSFVVVHVVRLTCGPHLGVVFLLAGSLELRVAKVRALVAFAVQAGEVLLSIPFVVAELVWLGGLHYSTFVPRSACPE